MQSPRVRRSERRVVVSGVTVVVTTEEFESTLRMSASPKPWERYLAKLTDDYMEKLIINRFREEIRARRVNEIVEGLRLADEQRRRATQVLG